MGPVLEGEVPTLVILSSGDDHNNVVFSCVHGIVEAQTSSLKPQDGLRATQPNRSCGCGAERIEYYWLSDDGRLRDLDRIGPYFGIESLAAVMSDAFRPIDCECDALPGIHWENGLIGPITQHASDCPEQPQPAGRMRFLRKEVNE